VLLSILHVDDDPLFRRVIAHSLEKAGFACYPAATTSEALALLRKNVFHLTITDLNRPGDSGLDFVREVKADSRLQALPVVVLSGNMPPELELECWRAGSARCFLKPISPADLVCAVQLLLGEARSDPDAFLIEYGQETRELDYKALIDLDNKTACAEFARDLLALTNSGGGQIIVGVSETVPGQFSSVGIPDSRIANYETTRLHDAVRRYVGDVLAFSSRIVQHKGRWFVLIRVEPTLDTLALPLVDNQNAGLFLGRVYSRTSAARSSEVTDPMELQALIRAIVDRKLRALVRGAAGPDLHR
jgi:CheY-like chemotaxis protein